MWKSFVPLTKAVSVKYMLGKDIEVGWIERRMKVKITNKDHPFFNTLLNTNAAWAFFPISFHAAQSDHDT